jgi:hypothetical protein
VRPRERLRLEKIMFLFAMIKVKWHKIIFRIIFYHFSYNLAKYDIINP